jgi:TonB-dependent SusC/RagA subfamily outer membrane receptor
VIKANGFKCNIQKQNREINNSTLKLLQMKIKTFLLILLTVFTVLDSVGQKSNKKIIITGYVLDANKNPINGAIIFIDNQKTEITSNENGFYRIKVRPVAKKISVFTFTNGLNEAEIGDRTVINFELKNASSSAKQNIKEQGNEETVNVGYGTVNKKDLTTPVGKIDGTNKKFLSYQNIYDMIRGELPGVQVTGKRIVIQGPTSINLSTDPLLVVDGVPVSSIDEISPQQVKSIEVLKGASASIYGSRGANGVVMIYLKGASEKK